MILAALLMVCLAGSVAGAETLFLRDPGPTVVEASSGAQFGFENGAFRPIRGVFSFSPPGYPPLKIAIQVPSSAEPGGLLRIGIESPEALEEVTAEIVDGRGRPVCWGARFRLAFSAQTDLWAVVIGMPSEAAEASYLLSVKARVGRRQYLQLSTVFMSKRSFTVEKIPLDTNLAQVRSSPNPRRDAESRVLARVLASPHPEALHEMGVFSNPLPDARRSAGYGSSREYVYPDSTRQYSVHYGIDLAAPQGTPIASSGKGVVVLAAERVLTGNTVVIEHLPGIFSLYYHMSEISVREGQIVEKGQLIGKVGKTGLATGPHLHWEVRVAGVAVDPDSLVLRALLDKQADFPDIVPVDNSERR